jgi:amino acid adenylation domain-containing protein
VMYTSGSTGQPKGVVIPHRAVNRLVINNRYVAIGPGDCVAHCSNPAFDASTFEIWGALLNGARLVIVPRSIVLDPRRLTASLHEQGVTILFLTTALFNQHVAALPDAFAGFKYVLFGGEAASANAVREVLRKGAPEHLLNLYGPTEATTFATYHRVESVPDEAMSLPIGRPVSNTPIYILDPRHRPVPVGETGEICIGGPGVALGYLNRSDLTAEKFIPDPFGVDSQARLYRTGDLGRWRTDGVIEFLGRVDLQVKIRGFRIEPREVEAHLAACKGVREASIVVREDAAGDRRLLAYVTAEEGATLSAGALRLHMAARVAEHMIPAAYVILDKLPLNANGKVDREKLPPPDETAFASREYEAPRTPVNDAGRAMAREPADSPRGAAR